MDIGVSGSFTAMNYLMLYGSKEIALGQEGWLVGGHGKNMQMNASNVENAKRHVRSIFKFERTGERKSCIFCRVILNEQKNC